MTTVNNSPTSFFGGMPKKPPDLKTALRRAYENSGQQWHARLGFAYVSVSGLEVLLRELNAIKQWENTRKRWILGLHHGITEPTAIARIRSLSRSEVRLFVGGNRLTANSLIGGPHFHAKVLCVERGRKPDPTCLLASSANLTGAALGPTARNYEAGTVLFRDAIEKSSFVEFNGWWRSAWQESIVVSDVVLDRYAQFRDKFLKKNPDTLSDLDPPSLENLAAATTLWIESGAMSGGSRNQVEFNQELAGFFGQISNQSTMLRIAARRQMWDDRPITPKTTTFNVAIWRLSLPTETAGGFEYPGKVIRFRRRRDRKGTFFELDVAELDSSRYSRWRSTAQRGGYVGLSSGRGAGRRAFGFY